MSTQREDAKARAEARFKKAEVQATEGAKAKSEHDARVAAVDANTARLKALRLAKEEADRATPPAAPARKRSAPKSA